MKRKTFRIWRRLLFGVTACCVIFVFSSSMYADYNSIGTPKPGIFYYTPTYNDTWNAPLNKARYEWNNPFCGVTVGSTTETTGNKLTAQSLPESWYGLTTMTSGSTFKFTIVINARTIARDATHFSNFVRSVTVHELGHIFWLKDNPNTKRSSIMFYSRNRNTMICEQNYDSECVDAKF